MKAGWVLFSDTLLTSWRLLGSELVDKMAEVNWKKVGEEMAKCPFKIHLCSCGRGKISGETSVKSESYLETRNRHITNRSYNFNEKSRICSMHSITTENSYWLITTAVLSSLCKTLIGHHPFNHPISSQQFIP